MAIGRVVRDSGSSCYLTQSKPVGADFGDQGDCGIDERLLQCAMMIRAIRSGERDRRELRRTDSKHAPTRLRASKCAARTRKPQPERYGLQPITASITPKPTK